MVRYWYPVQMNKMLWAASLIGLEVFIMMSVHVQYFSTKSEHDAMSLWKGYYHLNPTNLIDSIEEECRQSTCSQTLEARNMELHASLQQMSAIFTTAETYISLLASASSSSCETLPSNFRTIFEKLVKTMTSLYEIMKGTLIHHV